MTLTEKSGHLAWCALVALALAKNEGSTHSLAQEDIFLTRWLATAQKQRRFPRDVAPDIEWLLKQGRMLGVRANLADKLNYLWRACLGVLSEQNDLFRLTYCLETANDMHWNYRLLSDREWSGRYAVTINVEENTIHLSHSNLDLAFDDEGGLVNPLMARLSGRMADVEELLNRCGWQAESICDISQPHQYALTVRQGVLKKDD